MKINIKSLLIALLISQWAFSQLGINTTTPKATLDVVGQPDVSSALDGVTLPTITGDQLNAKTYTTDQKGAMLYVSSVPTNTNTQTQLVTKPGTYYFNGTIWKLLSTELSVDNSGNYVAMYHTGNISIPSGYNEVLIPYNTAIENTKGWFDSSTGKFTPQKEGYWLITARAQVGTSNTGENIIAIANSDNDDRVATHSVFSSETGELSRLLYFNGTTDFVSIWLISNTSKTTTQNREKSTFSAVYVSNKLPNEHTVVNAYTEGNLTPIVGDIKKGLQTADHNGWVKLDGRATATLPIPQQTNALNLGFSTNIPDFNNVFLTQNSGALGSITGSNEKTLVRGQLPAVQIPINIDENGNHSHGFNRTKPGGPKDSTNSKTVINPSLRTLTTGSSGNHSHTGTTQYLHSDNPTDPQTTIDITPKTLSVNMFVYLGV